MELFRPRAAHRWHMKMKLTFMKRDGNIGKDFIIHWIFVYDMKHVLTAKYLFDEFLERYSRDFKITGGHHLIQVA